MVLYTLSPVNDKILHNNQMGYIDGLRRWTTGMDYFFDPWTPFFYKHFGGAWGDDGFFQLRNQYNQPRRDNETNEIIATMTALKSYSTKTIDEMTI